MQKEENGGKHEQTADVHCYVLPPDFQKKLIDTVTISNCYSKFKENNTNDTSFLGCFLFQPTAKPNLPKADFYGAAISSPIFPWLKKTIWLYFSFSIDRQEHIDRSILMYKRA